MTSDPRDDAALMRAIAGGDTRALKALYDRYAGMVFTLACRMLRDRQEAEQLLTDVFFEIWEARGRYDETRAAPRTYLMRLAHSRAIDRMRRKGPVGLRGVSLDPAQGIDVAAKEDPAEGLEAADERARVARALGALEKEQRAAIEGAYFDGLSHAELAAKLNKPLGTVKSYIRLGLARLREVLRPANASERP